MLISIYSTNIEMNVRLPKHIRFKFINLFHSIFDVINFPRSYIFINIIYNSSIVTLNKEWKGSYFATDILTFRSKKHVSLKKREGVIGNIVLSINKVFYQSHILGISIYEELMILIIHGLLHLLGFDHEKNQYFNIYQSLCELKISQRLDVIKHKSLYYRIYTIYI
jgi:rRNA maturation RNase YbeY